MTQLEHAIDPCGGMWIFDNLRIPVRERNLVCQSCRATYPATEEIRVAAISENQITGQLIRLANEGDVLLRRDP